MLCLSCLEDHPVDQMGVYHCIPCARSRMTEEQIIGILCRVGAKEAVANKGLFHYARG